MPTEEELLAIKERAAARLMALPSVTGVGIGGRMRGGQPTGELVLKVYVKRKLPANEVDPAELVPAEIEGIPTDVSELAESGELTSPASGEITEGPTGKPPTSGMDERRQRPLIGGAQMQVDLSGSGLGTVGCLLVNTADTSKFYVLTNWHVLGGLLATKPTVGTTKAGQPTSDDSVTKCCSAIIGKVAGGAYDGTRDAGIVQLEPGMQWTADILEIGAISGRHAITSAEAAPQTYPVRKRGARSGLTGGTVQSIATTWNVEGTTFNNLVLVKPNPDPTQPAGTTLYFQEHGDSGAALVNSASEVVGLMFAAAFSGGEIGMGAAVPIEAVINAFSAQEHLAVEVAVAVTPGVVNTVPGAAMVALPPELAPTLSDPEAVGEAREPMRVPIVAGATLVPPPAAALARMQADLDRSERGRALLAFWLKHQRELLALVNENRRVAIVWHRSGGSALFQFLVRMVAEPELRTPRTLNGDSLSVCIERICTGIARFASPTLKADIRSVQATLPDLAGRNLEGIYAGLGAP